MTRRIGAIIIILTLLTIFNSACSIQATAAAQPPPAGPLTNGQMPLILEPANSSQNQTIYLPTVAADDPEQPEDPKPSELQPIVDTAQTMCYTSSGQATSCAGSGQDGAYDGHQPSYTANGDGTVTDEVTNLMWQQSPDLDGSGVIDAADKLTYDEALAYAEALTLAGYDDWRLPTIGELYSLINFEGVDPSGYQGSDSSGLIPFIDTDTFDFGYGDTGAGERIIDAQFASSTRYVSTTMQGNETMFGVNFADGRIKGYPISDPRGGEKTFYVLAVRGDSYGDHNYTDNGDGTISDELSGLMWTAADSGVGLNWDAAISYCESSVTAGYDNWRLPNIKELQNIVDYGRAPDTTNSAAIDPLFEVTPITNEAGQVDYPAFWSSTTHVNMINGSNAAYVNFGRSMGYMNGAWLDVHGAGAQRSDPKAGDPDDWPTGHGPQGDAIRIYNYVRCVRDVSG